MKNKVLTWPTSAPITGTSLKIRFWDKTPSVYVLNIHTLGQKLSAVYIKNKVLIQSAFSMRVPSFIAIKQEIRALYISTKVRIHPHLGSYFKDVLKTHIPITVHILSSALSLIVIHQHVRTLYVNAKALICPYLNSY
jgi:hypothetical protein